MGQKMIKQCYSKRLSGFTLIEMLVFIFIFTIVSLAFYRTLTVGIQVALDSKNRLGALALANEKMEIARNLKYEDVGTVNGIPDGKLSENEDVDANGIRYHVKTIVQYVDDIFDGSAPIDTVPNDYKRVKINVSWGALGSSSKEVSVVSQFVPPGLEVGSGDGVLSINIINSAGLGIPQAQVHIVNNDLSPAVNITQATDDNGNLIFPGAKQSIQKYAITVTKDDYEIISTIAPASVSYFPIDVHASVVSGLLNTKSIVIDLLSNLTVKSVNRLDVPIPNLGFHLIGGRILGSTSSIPAETVYILNSDEATDSDGEKKIAGQSPGQFLLSNIASVPGYTLIGIDPMTGFDAASSSYKFSLLPGTDKTIKIKFASNGENALLVKVLTKIDNLPVKDAQVKITNADGYAITLGTSFDGSAFFLNGNEPLADGDYSFEVSASGLKTETGAVRVDDGLANQEIKLTAA